MTLDIYNFSIDPLILGVTNIDVLTQVKLQSLWLIVHNTLLQGGKHSYIGSGNLIEMKRRKGKKGKLKGQSKKVIIVSMSIRDFSILAKLGTLLTIQDREPLQLSSKLKDWPMGSPMPSKRSSWAISQIRKLKTH